LWRIKPNNICLDLSARREVCEQFGLYLRSSNCILFGDWTVDEKLETYELAVLVNSDPPKLRRYLS
jgi:hypothetical protein